MKSIIPHQHRERSLELAFQTHRFIVYGSPEAGST